MEIQIKKIMITAFSGTSSEWLIRDIDECRILILPNDKVKDSEMLIEAISKETFDYVIGLGQRPNIKDKVHIETTARRGEASIDTDFDCESLKQLFKNEGIIAKISDNAGTSFCNELYYNGLKYIKENGLDTKMVFVHVPFMKNIGEREVFKRNVHKVLREKRL